MPRVSFRQCNPKNETGRIELIPVVLEHIIGRV
jgi:hypothetical protein